MEGHDLSLGFSKVISIHDGALKSGCDGLFTQIVVDIDVDMTLSVALAFDCHTSEVSCARLVGVHESAYVGVKL